MLRIILFSMFVYGLLFADDKNTTMSLSIKKIMADPQTSVGTLPSAIRWSSDSSAIYFRGKKVNDNNLYRVDAQSLEITAVDKMEPTARTNKAKTAKVYIENGDIYFIDIQKNTTQRLTKTLAREAGAYFSDSGIVFTKEQNLYLWSLKNHCYEQITNFVKGHKPPEKQSNDEASQWLEKQQLELIETLRKRNQDKKETSTSKEKTPCKIYTENNTLQNVKLSPDEQHVTFRLSKTGKAKSTIVPNYTTTSGYTQNMNARSKVGTVKDTSKMGIFDREKNKVYFVDTSDIPGIKDHPSHVRNKKAPRDVIIHGPFWSAKTNDCVVVVLAHDNKDRWIMKLDLSNGKLSLIDRQTDEAWIGGPGVGGWRWSSGNIGFLPDSSHLWFQSEKTGYSHLYIYDLQKNTKTQLTSGKFEIYSPKISANGKHWYFTANKTHPGERHLFRMPIMGGEMTQMTSMPGNNETYISPDETKIAIRNSFCNKPWELFVMENKPGSNARQVTHSTSEQFRRYKWRVPQIVTFPNRHGKKVYARLYRDTKNTNPKPGVIFVHGAGYLQNAHKWWSTYFREYMFHNFLVDNGYTVLDIDYSGSAGYGRDWRTAIYRHMGGDDLTDQVDGAQFLIAQCNVDPKNIGIYGGSYGGFITLMAMFKEANTFKAGAALRSVTDWAHYNHPYTSNILNTPAEDEKAYKRSSPIYFAEGLKGALLICHGMLDRNVQFQDVVRLAQRLIELEKDNWELAVYPLEGHSFVEPKSWRDEYQRIFQLFEKNLK
ncbi:S9 family peptidase [Candidatus Uabimicrobium amorphum]|uniref:Peptidase S9 n=1 Tax=Uabimicrobium amorphum TaxID=2596890 RepID=A0A5S9IUP4_UABAM|nr:prolyl oligopeptidase family serine peptidase [Candidatus Uabimicrobium amorphum]BBM87671.1 peptidase S9 [Candidatus Uabimicrobium amorphum]